MVRFNAHPDLSQGPVVVLVSSQQINGKAPLVLKSEAVSAQLKHLRKNRLFDAEKGELFPVADGRSLLIFAGLGDKAQLTATELRTVVRKALISPFLKSAKAVTVVPHDKKDESVIGVIEGIMLGSYVWDKYKKADKKSVKPSGRQYTIAVPAKKAYDTAVAVCEGVNFSRDLVNENAGMSKSDLLEQAIRETVKGHKTAELKVLKEKELKAKGLNLHLAVNSGSRNEPRLIIVKYTGASKKAPYTAVVGKGITFDTGGLNLKPSGYMETMRCDMAGAAAVAGALKNCLALKLKKNIIFALGVAENAIGGDAYKPGDVFKSYSGKTVEIGNTDAEGRLVLADALSFLVKNYKPARIMDLATLTGACVVALGHEYSGIVSNTEKLSRLAHKCAMATDDKAWPLPNYPELKDAVKSKIADIRNLGYPKGAAGTLTAAEFLRQFIDDTPWVHVDIAGTAFVDGPERTYYSHGATGAGVRLITSFVQDS